MKTYWFIVHIRQDSGIVKIGNVLADSNEIIFSWPDIKEQLNLPPETQVINFKELTKEQFNTIKL